MEWSSRSVVGLMVAGSLLEGQEGRDSGGGARNEVWELGPGDDVDVRPKLSGAEFLIPHFSSYL